MKHPRVIGNRFQIEKHAGRGGVGDVYLATDLDDGAKVAVKLVRNAGAKAMSRFSREAQMLAILNHPGIVQYIDHGTTEAGVPYLAMEWIEGESLDVRLRRGKLTPDEALALCLRIAKALRVAHWRGIVHRDLKPSNLYLVGGSLEHVKILDFGIARMLSSEITPLTETGTALGSPGYMSPEQAKGSSTVDSRADVFSLGSVLFHCLTGRAPFIGDSAVSLILRVVLDQPPRVRDLLPRIPPAIDELVARMIAKEPADRPASAAELVDDLEAIMTASDAPGIPAAPALTATERRMICAVLAHTHLGDHGTFKGGAPGATSQVTEEAERLLVPLLEQFGASVARLQGGLYLGTFPHDMKTPDVARRAARAALALTEVAPRAAISLAIHRIEGEGRSELGTALDQLTQALRRPGFVRVDEPTSGLLATDFEIDRDLDGFFVARERDPVEIGRNVLGRAVPLVGRRRELAALADVAREAWSRSAPRAALITGPSGSGKSRLRHELVARTRAAMPSLAVWVGRGDPMSTAVPWALVASIFRRLIQVYPGEPPELSRHKLAVRVSQSLQGDAFVRTTAFLGELIDARFPDSHHVELAAARRDPRVMSDRVEQAIIAWTRAEATRGPVCWVLEDLHWSDAASVEAMERVLRELGGSPVFVLVTALPSIWSRFAQLWPDHLPLTIELEPLGANECRELARHVLGGGAPNPKVEGAVMRSAGNPLYLEELLRAVASNRDPTTPGAILAMVESRLGELTVDHRRVVRAASIFGPVFWRGGVIELLGGSAQTSLADAALSELVRSELCVPGRLSRIPGDDEYVFRHAVIRDAAYEMLTDEDQKLGHRLAGRWLAATGATSPAVVAEHLERGGDRDGAIAAYRDAADGALRAGDADSALRLADRGRALGATGEPLGALLATQCEAHASQGRNEFLAEHGPTALALLPRDSPLGSSLARRLGRIDP